MPNRLIRQRAEHPTLSICHVDMDAFFAAIEQRDDPSLRGRPVVVGGAFDARGVVATCSYEARRFGIRSAMPAEWARNLCPEAVFLPTDFPRYQRVSQEIRDIMEAHGQAVEPVGLDEAFVYVPDGESPVPWARQLKQAITHHTRLTCSVGLSYAHPLAKLASEWQKPNGFTVIDAAMARQILPDLPLRKLWGIGPQTALDLERHGIVTGGDYAAASPDLLFRLLGRGRAWDLALLVAGRPLEKISGESRVKSISRERTFRQDIVDPAELTESLEEMVREVINRLKRRDLRARTVTLKVRYSDFRTLTRSRSFPHPVADYEMVLEAAQEQLKALIDGHRPVRLLGTGVSGLEHPDTPLQATLFSSDHEEWPEPFTPVLQWDFGKGIPFSPSET